MVMVIGDGDIFTILQTIMLVCQVLLYIQAEEVKNRKKQRKVETEVKQT